VARKEWRKGNGHSESECSSNLPIKHFFRFLSQAIVYYLGVLLVFFWSPVTGSKEQRSAKRRPHLEPPAPRGAPFPPAAAPPPSQELTSQPGLAAAIPALP
jgi:hypothetical protein